MVKGHLDVGERVRAELDVADDVPDVVAVDDLGQDFRHVAHLRAELEVAFPGRHAMAEFDDVVLAHCNSYIRMAPDIMPRMKRRLVKANSRSMGMEAMT